VRSVSDGKRRHGYRSSVGDVSLPSLKELQAKALTAGVPQRDVAMTFDDEEGRQSLQQMTASAEQAFEASLQASAAVQGIRDPVQGIRKQDPELRTSVAPVTLEFQKSWRTGYIEVRGRSHPALRHLRRQFAAPISASTRPPARDDRQSPFRALLGRSA